MINKKIYWGLRSILGLIGIGLLLKIVPYFMNLLQLLIDLFKLTDTTPEFKIILVCISIWVNVLIINTIVNIVFKLHSLLENKLIGKYKK